MSGQVGVGVIGTGLMGAFHAETLARRVPAATLVAVADPAPGAAQGVVDRCGAGRAVLDTADLLADPTVDAVVIAAPSSLHADLVVAAAAAGKAIFCEKPMALTVEDADRAIAAAAEAGVPLQVGFNRRFANDFSEMHDRIVAGDIGTPQLLRSVTRDPELADPSRVRPFAVYLETLIHDFDTLLWLNPGAAAVEVFAMADTLVRPDWKDRGLLDTSIVTIRFDNGALATAEASFQAVYGYDIRGEVFGSGGMLTAGDVRSPAVTGYGAHGVYAPTVRRNVDLFHDAYAAELVHFVDAVARGTAPAVDGADARAALVIALAAIESVGAGAPDEDLAVTDSLFPLAVCSELVFLDRPITERARRLDELGFLVEIWDWTRHDLPALAQTGARFSSMTGYVSGTLTDPAGADELVHTALESIQAAKVLGCPRLNLHGTGLDGRGLAVVPVSEVTGDMWLAARDTLTRIAELGAQHDVVFCLENLNTEVDHPGVPFARAADTMALVRAVDNPHLRMMLDLYHAQIGEGNLIVLLERAGDLIGEIQVADVPGRCEPGTGEINYPVIAQALLRLGYRGIVGFEGHPSAAGDDVALERFRVTFS